MDTESEQLRHIFAREGAERLDQLDAHLLELEKDPTSEDISKQCLGLTHSLKGAAGTAGATLFADVAHTLEDIFGGLQSRQLATSGELFDDVFAAIDALKQHLDRVDDRRTHEDLVCIHQRLSMWCQANCDASSQEEQLEPAVDFELGEYDTVRMRAIKRQGKSLVHVTLTPLPETDWWSKIQDALRRLRREDDVVATAPPRLDPDLPDRPSVLRVLLGTLKTPEELHDVIESDSEGTVSVRVDPYDDTAPTNPPISSPTEPRPQRATSTQPWLKVDLSRVDSLVDMVGELVIIESMVVNAPEVLAIPSRKVTNNLSQMTRITRDLQDVAMRMRMVPLDGLFNAMARTVRDLSRRTHKHIHFSSHGAALEMDRNLIEGIRDPLVHLVRNAVDHGIETPQERKRTNKPAIATLSLSACHQGGNVVLRLADDGRGINRARVAETARERNWLKDGHNPTDAELFSFLFVPGFSTALEVTDVSGRGVGLDVVRRSIEEMRGRISVTSIPSRGTTFEMVLPLTLAIIDGTLTVCGTEQYIIPTLSVVESIRPTPQTLVRHKGQHEVLDVRGEIIPLIRLAKLFGVRDPLAAGTDGLAVVLESAGRKIALLVDEVVSQQQVVIKTIGAGIGRTDFLSGAAILPDGRVGLILNVDEIVHSGGKHVLRSAGHASREFAAAVLPEQATQIGISEVTK